MGKKKGAKSRFPTPRDASQFRGYGKRRGGKESRVAAPVDVGEPSESVADQSPCQLPDFESNKQFSAQSDDESSPTTADQEIRLPEDPAEPSLSFLPMGKKKGAKSRSQTPRDASQFTGSGKRCGCKESRVAAPVDVGEPSESVADQSSCQLPNFESNKQLSAQSDDESSPTTADQEIRLPEDPAEPSEIKRWSTGGSWFRLTDSCLLALHQGSITKWSVDGKTDAIVNAANQGMLGGGGVDGAIHRAAGPELHEACRKLPCIANHIRCRTGDAVITSGFQLPVSKIIHAVGPIYEDMETSAPLLENAYKNSIAVAVQNDIKYICFPAISCGVYGYPHDEAAEIALRTVIDNASHLKEIHFVLFEDGPWLRWLSRADESFEKLCE